MHAVELNDDDGGVDEDFLRLITSTMKRTGRMRGRMDAALAAARQSVSRSRGLDFLL